MGSFPLLATCSSLFRVGVPNGPGSNLFSDWLFVSLLGQGTDLRLASTCRQPSLNPCLSGVTGETWVLTSFPNVTLFVLAASASALVFSVRESGFEPSLK